MEEAGKPFTLGTGKKGEPDVQEKKF